MKKWISKIWMLAALLLAFGTFSTTAYGEEISVSLLCDEQVAAESSFSASLEYAGASFGSATTEVTYDPQVLEFRSCSGGDGFEAEEGLARISLSGGDGKAYLSCKIRFRALSEGESFITVTTADLTAADGTQLVAETRSVKVTVSAEVLEVSGENVMQEESGDAEGDSEGSSEENSEEVQHEGGLLGFFDWAKAGIEDGSFAAQAADGLHQFMEDLSIMEFLVLSLCVSLILLLMILLAAEKRKGKR